MTSRAELLIRLRLTALSRTLPGARQGSPDAIHRARVATRRLREALPLVATGARADALGRRVRRLTRIMGPVRELDVALQLLDEFERAGDVPRAGIIWLRDATVAERRRLHAHLVRSVDRARLDKISKKAIAAAQKCDAKPHAGARDPRQRERAERRAARRAERLKAAMESAAGIYLPDRLHEVRIAVKKLRYAIEIAEDMRGQRATRARQPSRAPRSGPLRTLVRAQDLLGRLHDLEVLIARTRGVQGSSGPDLGLSGDLDRFVRRLEMECRVLHGHYIALRSALADICEGCIAKARRRSSAA